MGRDKHSVITCCCHFWWVSLEFRWEPGLEGCEGSFGYVALIEGSGVDILAYIPILFSDNNEKSNTHLIPLALIDQIQQRLPLEQSI